MGNMLSNTPLVSLRAFMNISCSVSSSAAVLLMSTMSDWSLIQAFVEHRSEAAFGVLLRRHLDLVYSTALRQLGDHHDAEEVAQIVFSRLAQKAHCLKPGTSVAGWLYRSTCLEARMWWRGLIRRRQREREVMAMTVEFSGEQANWEQIAPFLDEAMLQLTELDRGIMVLRYFQNRTLGEVGLELGFSEDAARMRVNRALEQLREYLLKKGVVCTPMALGVFISERAVHAAPASVESSLLHAITKIIRPTVGVAVLSIFGRLGLVGKGSVTAVSLLLVLGLATYVIDLASVTSILPNLMGTSRTTLVVNQIAPNVPSSPVVTASTLKPATIEGIITIVAGTTNTEVSHPDAPIMNLAAAGAKYRLIFPGTEPIQALASGNLYRVKGFDGGNIPTENEWPRHWFQVQNVTLIKEYAPTDRKLLEASAARNFALMREMITNGADINIRSVSFKTCLHNLLLKRLGPESSAEEARLLLEAGADVNAIDEDGRTPLYFLFCQHPCDTNVLELLLSYGANPSIPDFDGWTAWAVAGYEAHEIMRKALPDQEPDYGKGRPPVPVVAPLPNTYIPPLSLVKHRAVTDFLASPARDTPECRTMLQLLWENGYGIEMLGPVYAAAMEITRCDHDYIRAFDSTTGKLVQPDQKDNDAKNQGRNIALAATKARFMDKFTHQWHYAIPNCRIESEPLRSRLLDIRTIVSYDPPRPLGGPWYEAKPERELNDQDVQKYIQSHPVIFQPFKLTSDLSPEEVSRAEADAQAAKARWEEAKRERDKPL
jgi:RNA polymerase sigma factor (sigma-70 family)